jgi:hypothetical protein
MPAAGITITIGTETDNGMTGNTTVAGDMATTEITTKSNPEDAVVVALSAICWQCGGISALGAEAAA